MASQKDKDYHKLRNPEKYAELGNLSNDIYGNRDKESAEAHKRYEKILSKYGFKSMVGNKRRRNSTRKSNQKDKKLMHKMQRAKDKNNLLRHLKDQNKPVMDSIVIGDYSCF